MDFEWSHFFFFGRWLLWAVEDHDFEMMDMFGNDLDAASVVFPFYHYVAMSRYKTEDWAKNFLPLSTPRHSRTIVAKSHIGRAAFLAVLVVVDTAGF